MITDIHVHPVLAKGDRSCFGVQADKIIDCMDRVGIAKANLMPIMSQNGSYYGYNSDEETTFAADFLSDAFKKYPGRFYGMVRLNAYLPMDFLSGFVTERIINGPVHGVKLLTEMNMADRRVEPLAAFLEKHGVPVLIHAWYKTVELSGAESSPADVAVLAGKFPGLNIIMAHMRGSRFRGVQDIKRHKNVSIDTSGSESEDGYLAYALAELGERRILYGSDYPGRDIATALGRIESVDMPNDVRAEIFNGNAARLLGGERS